MRHSELTEGVDVLDGDGNVVGSSKIAAKHVSGWLVRPCHRKETHSLFKVFYIVRLVA